MSQLPNLRPLIAVLLTGVVTFPIAICVVFGVGALLTATGDLSGGFVMNRISLALAVFWVLDLIVLVFFQGLTSFIASSKNSDDPEEP